MFKAAKEKSADEAKSLIMEALKAVASGDKAENADNVEEEKSE